MRKNIFFLLLLFSNLAFADIIPSDECVILLHGLGDGKISMLKLEKAISEAGFDTYNVGYPAFGKKIENIAEDELEQAIKSVSGYKKIHIVCHSMGGLITRYYLKNHELPLGSRIVMLSPPNNGSEVADYFEDSKIYHLFYGDVGLQLTTDNEIFLKLPKLNYEVGVIAGDESTNPFFSMLLPGKDDGRVAVESTFLPEMIDFVIISTTHLFIKYNEEATKQTIYFLKNGKFMHEKK